MTVLAGQRRTRGTIYSPSVVQDASGFEVETYAELAVSPEEWVQIEPLRASETIAGQQVFGTTTAMLRMRFRDDLTERMMFVSDEGDAWDFIAPPIDPDGRRKELEILVGKSD